MPLAPKIATAINAKMAKKNKPINKTIPTMAVSKRTHQGARLPEKE
jgi:hypothetical protein